jgi:hypothetical protein
VLDRTRDSDGDVEVWGDDLAGLSDLVVVRHVACIDRCTRSTHRSVQLVRHRLQHLEVLAALHAATTGDDDPCGRQFGTVGLRDSAPPTKRARPESFTIDTGSMLALPPSAGAPSKPVVRTVITLRASRLYRCDHVAGVDRTLEGIGCESRP